MLWFGKDETVARYFYSQDNCSDMILGVYWYFAFPTELYKFDYFRFRKGLGGHADAPAELTTTVAVADAGKIISRLRTLTEKYGDALLFIYREGNQVRIETGNYTLFDYDFLFAKEVEKVLLEEDARMITEHPFANAEFIKLQPARESVMYPSREYFSVVGSSIKKYGAETLALRLDCHIDGNLKTAFLDDLAEVTGRAGIDVLYYLQSTFEDTTNLMLFLTNGRQGVLLAQKKRTDTSFLQKEIARLFAQYGIGKGHAGGWDAYPRGEPSVMKIVDREFILGDTIDPDIDS